MGDKEGVHFGGDISMGTDKEAVRRSNRRSSMLQARTAAGNKTTEKAVKREELMSTAVKRAPEYGAPYPVRPPDRTEMGLSAEALVELRKVFKAAEKDTGGLLDQETFLQTCLTIPSLQAMMSQEQLKHLYMKVDVNAEGGISFHDFSSYLLSQQAAKENEPAAEHTTFVRATTFGCKRFGRCDYEDSESSPSDEEEKPTDKEAAFYPKQMREGTELRIPKPGNIIEKVVLLGPLDAYVTSSQDGMLKIWTADTLKPLRSFQNGSGAWITDMVLMPQQPLAVFALDRSVTFYDTARLSFDCVGRITYLENAPLCAEWLRFAGNDKLLYGDDLGILHTYSFNDEWGADRPNEGFGETVKKLPPGMSEGEQWALHTDWMTSTKFLPHQLSLITTGMDGCMNMVDFEKRQRKWLVKEHSSGINACDYSRTYNYIVTCGVERYISIWNPFTAKITGVLHGHQASVTDVRVNEVDNQIVSISADCVIKVWDVRSSRCLQTIKENTELEPTRVTLHYDSVKEVMLAGSDKLEMWHKRRPREARTALIAAMAYNPLFRQVVVAEVDSLVMVWSIDTGEDTFTFSDTQRKTKITCMAFDVSWRRLIIGAQDGSIRFWNFNNGQVLKELTGWGPYEVTCLVSVNASGINMVAAGGWNNKVCRWTDTAKVDVEKVAVTMTGHSDDVTCICFCAPASIVTGGSDSKVMVWRMDGSLMRKIKTSGSKGHDQDPDYKVIVSIVFLRELARAVVVSVADGWLRFMRLHDGKQVHELFTENHGKVGPICADVDCTVLYSADSKGYVKSWDLTECHFEEDSIEKSTTPLLSDFRAHHEPLISMVFVDEDNLLLTCSRYGTVRLWNSVGSRIGQFGQHMLWNIKAPATWKFRERSYMIHPSIRQGPEGTWSNAHTPTRLISIAPARPSGSATSQPPPAPPPPPKLSEEELKRWNYEAKKKAILDRGPPHLRLETWFTPLANNFKRQLAIKKLSPLLPLVPPGLSPFALAKAEELAAERTATPMSTPTTKKRSVNLLNHLPFTTSLPIIRIYHLVREDILYILAYGDLHNAALFSDKLFEEVLKGSLMI